MRIHRYLQDIGRAFDVGDRNASHDNVVTAGILLTRRAIGGIIVQFTRRLAETLA